MIPFTCLPASAWALHLETLAAHPGPLWIQGPAGSGISTLAQHLASRRGGPLVDDAEDAEGPRILALLREDPRTVVGTHARSAILADLAAHALVVELASFEDDPGALPRCLQALAREEGVDGPLPPVLAQLPCPGELRGLRNRLLRWKVLGQLPAPGAEAPALPLEQEDVASNLHVLERLLLHRALRRSYGNRVEAARRLGVSRRQLYLLIQRHGDPVRGESPVVTGPQRLLRAQKGQNSSGE